MILCQHSSKLPMKRFMNKIPITIIIPVKNEESNLKTCLQRLGNFSEIIVVDSNSTDSTKSIAIEFGVRFVDFKWNGKYPKKRNWTLDNISIKNDWVLFLDADELVTEQFEKEITKKIKNPNISGYWLYYNNFFMTKEQKYGLKMRKLSLFKKKKGRYEKIKEDNWSSLDMEVHEHPILNGKVGYIKSAIIHNDCRGLSHYIQKHNEYSTWEAYRFIENHKFYKGNLTRRQKLKYFLMWTGMLPYIYFIFTYFFKLGFLDGRTGLYLALYKAQYFFQIQTKISELKLKE